jgi:hypothetical protein
MTNIFTGGSISVIDYPTQSHALCPKTKTANLLTINMVIAVLYLQCKVSWIRCPCRWPFFDTAYGNAEFPNEGDEGFIIGSE